ncbi:MAG TPA: helix-turn-helix transcriptional regulator [Nevskia sp.]|nr:helix-turn-helix transcriptional regulator [Nevskia sp.]
MPLMKRAWCSVDAEFPQRLAAGRAMRAERTARGESLYAAAQRLGMTSAQLSALENGRKH